MGIHINLATLLLSWIRRHRLSGPTLTLGVQHVSFYHAEFKKHVLEEPPGSDSPRPMTAVELFEALGLGRPIALDVSDHEGADILFDLNRAECPDDLRGRFGVVFNGGTLEHIFHIPNALANISALLRPGGVVIHVLPLNNWVDHGYFQFSPTLMFDYYSAARFELLESLVAAFDPRRAGGATWEVSAAPRGLFGQGSPGTLDDRSYLHLFLARRTEQSADRPIPIQSVYSAASVQGAHMRWFSTFYLHYGRREDRPNRLVVPLRQFEKESGYAWVAPVPELTGWCDTNGEPARSRVVILENELALGPSHSRHEAIRTAGAGAYSHWGEVIYLSTSDNSDPRTNGRRYVAVLPAFTG
jgi:SAM-dependent methyltransferase